MMRNTEVLPRIVFEIGFGIGIAEASIFAHVLSIYFDRNCITRLGCEPWDIIRVLMVAREKVIRKHVDFYGESLVTITGRNACKIIMEEIPSYTGRNRVLGNGEP